MKQVNCEKYIGMLIDKELNFKIHLAEKMNSANRVVGLIRRTFTNLDGRVFKTLYIDTNE